MPKLELGDLDSVAKSKEANIPVLAKYARNGFAILTAVPSCTLMFKQEIPLMYPDDADVQAVKEAMWDPFEYLMRAQARRPAQDRLQPAAGQGQLPRALPQPGAEHRPQDRGTAQAGARHLRPDQRALLGARRHFRREEAVPRHGDEDRQAAVQEDGRAPAGRAARLHQLRLPAGRPPHQPGIRRQFARHARSWRTRSRCCGWPTG